MLLNVARPSVVPPVPSPVTADGSPASLVPLPLPSKKTVQPPRYGSVAALDPFALRSWYLYTFNVPVLRVLVIEHTTSSPLATWTELLAPTATLTSSPSLIPLLAVPVVPPLSLKQVKALAL